MPRPTFARKRRRRAEDDYVRSLIQQGDLEGLADLLNRHAGAPVAEVDEEGIRLIPGAVTTDVDVFRRLVREDPAGALDLVRGPPLDGINSAWAVPVRAQLQSEIVAAAHSACRLDPANALEYLHKGLLGAPEDTSLWIALLGVAGRSTAIRAVELTYRMARETYASAGPGTVPTEVTREYTRWQRQLGAR